MKIIYKTENARYFDLINKYRQESNAVKNKQYNETQQRVQNKHMNAESEREVLFCEIKSNNLEWDQEPFKLPDKSYTFVKFVNTKMGKHAILSEDDMYESGASFWNVTFIDCIFQNIKFKNCRFFGCKFINCKTDEFGVVFEDCFFDEISTGFNENKEFQIYNISTEFVNCMITSVKFIRCNLDKTLWERCTLMLTSYNKCTLKDGIFLNCSFYSTVVNDTDIAGVGILKMKNAGLQFYGKYENSEFHKSTYIELMDCKIKLIKAENENSDEKKKTKKISADLSMMYYTLLNCLQSKNSDINFLSEYRYQYQKHHMIAKEKWYMQIWDRISWVICGFGERLGRFALWFSSSILFFAICYMFSGLQLLDYKIQYTLIGGIPASIGQVINDFGMCIHFSIVTFSTVGYGNITPLNGISTFLCTVQILVGILFVAMFTSIMIKKLIRE